MLKSISRRGIFSLFLSLLSVGIVMAQTSCPELVQSALAALDENCQDTSRNLACYGYDESGATFLDGLSDNFAAPSSLVAVTEMIALRTHALETQAETWGLSVAHLQANIPNALPEQNLVLLSMGDVEIENAVNPDEAFVPSEGITVTVTEPAGANLRSGPSTEHRVIGSLRIDETAIADGISEDGQWLRVVYGDQVGWLSITVIDDNNPELRDLPTLNDSLLTSMQSFYLRSEMNAPECDEAPDNILLVQAPENIESYFSVNGADIRLGSSGALRILMIDERPYLEIIVFDGTFEVDGKRINTGQRSVLCLGDEQSRGLDGISNDMVVTCEASDPETIDPVEFAEEWCILEDIPRSILNYSIEIRCSDELVSSNNNTSGTESEIGGVDCGEFSILTSDIPATNFMLSWSPAAGANSYDVAIYDSTGYQTSLHTGITGTSIGLNGGSGIASAGWIDVRAFLGGVYACYTRLNFNRSGDPNEESNDNVVGDISISATCYYNNTNGAMESTVTWSGLASGETISASITVALVGSDSDSASGGSGSMNLSIYTDIPKAAQVRVTTSNGSSYTTNC